MRRSFPKKQPHIGEQCPSGRPIAEVVAGGSPARELVEQRTQTGCAFLQPDSIPKQLRQPCAVRRAADVEAMHIGALSDDTDLCRISTRASIRAACHSHAE